MQVSLQMQAPNEGSEEAPTREKAAEEKIL